MDNKENITPEELASEQQALADVKEEEIRATIISEYGFDEEADAERIEKLTKKEIDNRKKLSSAIGQKIKYRNQIKSGDTKTPSADKTVQKEEFALTEKDRFALFKSDVHEDDIEDVVEYAKFKKLSVSDVLKLTEVKAKLNEKNEFRKSAEAANTGSSKRVISKPSPEKLLSELSQGKVPEAGTADAEELFWARRGGKR